jgi:hypothetical protein
MLHACLYTICLLFHYTSWHCYAFSGTNLLTSRHSAIFLFFAVLEVIHRKYSRNWTKQVPEVLFLPEASRDPKRSYKGATRAPHTKAARPGAWLCPLCVRSPRATSDDAPLPMKPSDRKNLRTRSIFQNTSRSTTVIDPKIRRV